MVDELSDILRSKNIPSEPEEFKIIRKHVLETYGEKISLKMNYKSIVVGVDNGAFASELQLNKFNLEKMINNKYKLVIRIL